VRLAGAIDRFKRFVEKHNLPFVSTMLGRDILPDHPLRKGTIGTHGNQEACDAVKAATNILIVGARMSQNSRGYNDELVLNKKLTVIDVDISEWAKLPVQVDTLIEMDAYEFLHET
jgi:thiamine pyrophosphate-dependent acetolactate synthase large subunit-like protein